MPIIEFTTDRDRIPADAHNLAEHATPSGMVYWTWETYVGLCIRDYERNWHDDSDFMMTVWDPAEGRAREICFATTRGWTYPAYGSRPDATPEVMEAYEAWRERQARQARARQLREERKRMHEMRRAAGITVRQFQRLRDAVADREPGLPRYLRVLASALQGRLRSEFRKSLAAQIRAWVEDPKPAYRTPLSPRQAQYL